MEIQVSPTQHNPYFILLAETSIFGFVLVKILLFIQQLYIYYPQWAETILGTRNTEMPVHVLRTYIIPNCLDPLCISSCDSPLSTCKWGNWDSEKWNDFSSSASKQPGSEGQLWEQVTPLIYRPTAQSTQCRGHMGYMEMEWQAR